MKAKHYKFLRGGMDLAFAQQAEENAALTPKWLTMEETQQHTFMKASIEGSAIVQEAGTYRWYYYDESWAHVCGPFIDRASAKASLDIYIEEINAECCETKGEE